MSQIQGLGATDGGGGTVTSVDAGDTTDNVVEGLKSTAVGSVTTIELTNRYRGTLQTTDETPDDIITIPLGAVSGVYIVDVHVVAFDVTDTSGAGYHLYAAIRTDTSDSTLCGTPDKWVNEEASMSTADANVVAGGVGDNNLYVRVTGIAAKTIEWKSLVTYTFVSA